MSAIIQSVTVFVVVGSILFAGKSATRANDLEVANSQAPADVPPTPAESLAKIRVPEGFRVTLFAGEPDIRQPIAMDIDDRGRLWVVECYSYTDGYFRDALRDRVLIFTDTDNDGQFDERTLFWDQGQRVSGIAIGFDGVWLAAAPQLLFLADEDRDDRPDGEPVVMLDGFEAERAGHNVVNGLRWGPDGWLYGRHGILATSLVGRPGASTEQRTAINCGVWRFHPTQFRFEAVVHGTTNPWGMDFDDLGNLFFTNNVIGHLFHAIPGAHYERMYGSDLNPYVYHLMPMCADHYHWDTGVTWQQTREGVNNHPELGGGHSHVGGMIYLGDNWPDRYRHRMFICNTHGKRVNCDAFQPHGSGYVAVHEPDFLSANESWFRGIDMIYGPDGGVYLSDWSDLGECHDHDGVHRTSGRIYKIIHGMPRSPVAMVEKDLRTLSDDQLLDLHTHANDWFVRHARRILQERNVRQQLDPTTASKLRDRTRGAGESRERLRWLWSTHVIGQADTEWLSTLLVDNDIHVRRWAVRLLADTEQWPHPVDGLAIQRGTAESDPSVRLEWASALRRMDNSTRVAVARGLVAHAEDDRDVNLGPMVWYGVEPSVAANGDDGLQLLKDSKVSLVRQLIARRVTERIDEQPAVVDHLVRLLSTVDAMRQQDILQGMQLALRGRRQVSAPAHWETLQPRLIKHDDRRIAEVSRELSVLFGSGIALEEVRAIALDTQRPVDERRQALRSVITAGPDDFAPRLQQLLNDRAVEDLAAMGLGEYDHPETPAVLIKSFARLDQPARRQAMATLSSRASYARALLQGLADGAIAREEITPADARQLHNLGDEQVRSLLEQHWGSIRTTSAERREQMDQYRRALTPDRLALGAPDRGRVVFDRACATCHKMFGNGATIGPDLTGGNRANLDYLLENIVDPSAMVATSYRTSVVELADGRVLNGVVLSETEHRVVLQMPTEQRTLERKAITHMTPTQQSLMADGLLKELSEQQLVDLFRYLASPEQIAPAASATE